MNIYVLEKQSTPGPWEVGVIADGSTHIARFLRQAVPFNKHGGKLAVTSSYEFEASQTGTHSGPWISELDATLAVHCRNNFMKALAALKQIVCFAERNGMKNCHDEPQEFCEVCVARKLISELEEVKI